MENLTFPYGLKDGRHSQYLTIAKTMESDGEGILVSQLANGKSRYVMLLNRSIDNTQNITFYLGESVKRITPFNGEEKLNAGRQTVTLTPGNYAIYKIK